ncbi:hypothetical protein OKA04_01660 [Luteolibacter flavescens]|uniref:Uncharacterized protein n=1 Tax=Luteolibacter flavescens TaxID=1859460 RepID=A0ABT3FIP9_9BACT|nr:hypothetical protein [Luteolibacter flavescens]MCW1883415.1 hypothetical protein [Luteolibacter flavescens]
MSDPSDELAKRLLSAFELGPSWARSDAPAKKQPEYRDEEAPRERRDRGDRDFRGRRDDRGGDRRDHRGGGGGGGGGGRRDDRQRRDGGGGDRRFQGQGQGHGHGRDHGPRDFPQPAEGVRVSIAPAAEAVHLVVKEIHHVARVYSLYDVAQILLAGRERYHLQFAVSDKVSPIFKSKLDSSLWLTKEEAISHFWHSAASKELYESEEVETEPPAGNFQVVARCGMSGEWLGPPNFHGYQTALRRIHREQFATMPFEVYSSRVRTERGEEAVNAWLETMKKRVRWRLKDGGDDAWSFDRGEIERDFTTKRFAEVFEEVRSAEIPGNIPARDLSPGLLACVRIASSHARKHAAILIPAICRLLENEHLSVFKREGKLFTGPARPHPLTTDAILAERPSAIVEWLEKNPTTKLADLWKGVLPEGETEPSKEWFADLFWLLTQGHVLLFADDSLVLPRRRAPQGTKQSGTATAKAPATKSAKKKRKKRKRKARAPMVAVPTHAKTVRTISRMSVGKVRMLRGPEMLWRRRLVKRGKIASLVEEE